MAVALITDGDSQETSQLDNAIDAYFPQAIRVRCIWRVVDRGMNANFLKSQVHHSTRRLVLDAYDKSLLQVRQLFWSWPEPNCEAKEEFHLSNALFYSCFLIRMNLLLLCRPWLRLSSMPRSWYR
jgi:hypothetical protein